MGEAKRRQQADQSWGKSPPPRIPDRIEQMLTQAQKSWALARDEHPRIERSIARAEDKEENIYAKICDLPHEEKLWAIEQLITIAEIMRERERVAKRAVRKARKQHDKPNELTAGQHLETCQTAENLRAHHPPESDG
jgi:hypothetical protein